MNSSKWKSPFQKKKRERQQPKDREQLGFLEKKKDYLLRARSYQKKEKELRDLKREAELRNPNEFYFGMIGDAKKKPKETQSKPMYEFTKEQRLIMNTRGIAYVQMKMQRQMNKIDNLKKLLPVENTRTIKIYSSIEEALEAQSKAQTEEKEQENEVREDILKIKEEIEFRENTLKQLQEVYNEMKLQNDLKSGEFKKLEDEDGNVEYVWKKERKR